MAEIGVERLRAGHHQEHGAEREEADDAVVEQEARCRSHGLNANSTAGFWPMCQSPAAAIAANQTSMTGPKKAATLRGAARLHREQRDQDHAPSAARRKARRPASTTFRPSTAESTDSAGVMMASP